MKLLYAPVATLAIGILLVGAFQRAPRYANPAWSALIPDMDTAAFYKAQSESLTAAARLADAGTGLAVLGLCSGAGVLILGMRHVGDLKKLRTPTRRWPLFILANATWLAFIPAEWWWLGYTLRRGDYPWWGDSIAIGMAIVAVGIIYSLPIINAGLLVCLWNARLPTSLWVRPAGWWPLLSTIVLVILVCLTTVELLEEVLWGNWLSIPLVLSVLYLLFCARAAAASSSGLTWRWSGRGHSSGAAEVI